MPIRLAALDRKLLRDLWEMKGQALAIAAVIAAGVAMFVTYLSNFESLRRTPGDLLRAARASPTSSPRSSARREARGADRARFRASKPLRRASSPTSRSTCRAWPSRRAGRLISLPERGRPLLNDLYLRRGRWIDPARPDEVLASESFCEAHGFGPGDQVAAVINGRRRALTIVGVALSPEYVYAIRPGELFPDKRRFGIFWMDRRALASAFDMEGGFNDVSLRLARGVAARARHRGLDRLHRALRRPRRHAAGAAAVGLDARERAARSCRASGSSCPLIFLGVAAFILNVALTRALALQRPQIAALKALGYANRELAWHYIKWALRDCRRRRARRHRRWARGSARR